MDHKGVRIFVRKTSQRIRNPRKNQILSTRRQPLGATESLPCSAISSRNAARRSGPEKQRKGMSWSWFPLMFSM